MSVVNDTRGYSRSIPDARYRAIVYSGLAPCIIANATDAAPVRIAITNIREYLALKIPKIPVEIVRSLHFFFNSSFINRSFTRNQIMCGPNKRNRIRDAMNIKRR